MSVVTRPLGLIGIGTMGLPMALNLLRSGTRLVVWNRSWEKCAPLQVLHAELAPTAAAVFATADIVILMLATAQAMDVVLERGTPAFAALVSGHTVINTGTTSPAYSPCLRTPRIWATGRATWSRCWTQSRRGDACRAELSDPHGGACWQFESRSPRSPSPGCNSGLRGLIPAGGDSRAGGAFARQAH